MFHPYLENVVVDVEEEPTPEDLASVEGEIDADDDEVDDGEQLLFGVFRGVPITEQGYRDHFPNQIVIFRRPLEEASRSRDDLIRNIRGTVVHELAHHFGFSEDDLEEFERTQEKYLNLDGE